MKVIRILKPIPVHQRERIEPLGLFKVHKELDQYYLIESAATGKGVWVRKDEAEIAEGETMSITYRELATCIKFLEMIRFKLSLGHYDTANVKNQDITYERPIEEFFINEFPFNSAFCYVFRKFKVNGTAPKDVHVCFCPLEPYKNTNWPIHRGKYIGSDGNDVHYARRSCNHFKSKKTKDVRIRSETKRLEMVEQTSVLSIMRHLKKIKLSKVVRKRLTGLWFIHIKHRVDSWESTHRRKFL